jgi:hypothetical protein
MRTEKQYVDKIDCTTGSLQQARKLRLRQHDQSPQSSTPHNGGLLFIAADTQEDHQLRQQADPPQQIPGVSLEDEDGSIVYGTLTHRRHVDPTLACELAQPLISIFDLLLSTKSV